MHRPSPAPALLALAALAAFGAGCASSDEPDRPPVATSTAGAAPLYELPEMKRALAHHEKGTRALENAYAAKRWVDRETNFNKAWDAFEEAQESYHAALPRAPERYHPVIEREIETVAAYMRQIQKDRTPPP